MTFCMREEHDSLYGEEQGLQNPTAMVPHTRSMALDKFLIYKCGD